MSELVSSSISNGIQDLIRLVVAKTLPPPARRRDLRVAAGLSITEIADALAVSAPTAWRWETGRGLPRSREAAVAYATLLDSLASLAGSTTEAAD